MANGNGSGNGHGRPRVGAAVERVDEKVRGSQAWNSIFRPGSVYRRGYTDSPRNRSYVVMLGLDLKLWVMWQRRREVKEAPAAVEGAPVKRSRFGRPVRVRS